MFKKPEADVVEFLAQDIVTTSGDKPIETPDQEL